MVVSTLAPEHQQRDLVSKFLGEKLVWLYIHAPLDICMQLDPKGIYKRDLEGQIKQLINFPSRFPRPQERENNINTIAQNIDDCYHDIMEAAKSNLTDFAI